MNIVKENIKEYIEKKTGSEIAEDLNIIETGIVDSFGMIELISFIETEFGISVDMEEVSQENFHSVETISKTLEAWLKSGTSKKRK